MRRELFLVIVYLLIAIGSSVAQSNYTESLTISTYYPSPYGVYRNLEAKKALSVGNFTGAPSGLNSVQDLQDGQLYIGYSEIFKGLSSDPPGKAGQVIYNSNQKMLKFCDGSKWVNTTCTTPLCGSSNGKNLRLAPAASTLCAVGTASAITGSGPWYWQCTNGAATSCFANLTADGVCGGAAIAHPNSATTWIGLFCSVGTANPVWTAFPAAGSSASWTCLGLNGGTNRPCSGSHDIGTPPPAAPACGSSDGQTLSAAPAANLCSSGTASAVSGSGPWNWTCTGSTSVSCSANLATTAPACGLSNGQTFSAAPAANLCSSGIASAVSGSGPWNWTCTGSTSVSCSADLAAAVNGACGPAATTYAYSATAWTGALCSAGDANPAAPAFPAAGSSATWTCAGSNGGTSAACSATHAGVTAIQIWTLPVTPTLGVGTTTTKSASFTLPAGFTHVTLTTVGIDDTGEVYFNGTWVFHALAPAHAQTPNIDITALVHTGVNTVTTDIIDAIGISMCGWVAIEYY